MLKVIGIGSMGILVFFITVGSLNAVYNDDFGLGTYQKETVQEKESKISDETREALKDLLNPSEAKNEQTTTQKSSKPEVSKEDEADPVPINVTEDTNKPPVQETETAPIEVVESEPEPQVSLACKTSGSGTYTLDTDGRHAYGYYIPSSSNPNVLEWSIEVEQIPSDNSYWFFAFNFSMNGTFRPEQPQVGGYAGLQVSGKDRLAIFSVWGADTSEGSGGLSAAEIYEDGAVNRILGDYPWKISQKYNFKLVKNSDNMVLYIDGNKVGTHYLPVDYPDDFNSRISLFVEWFGTSDANFPVCASFTNFSPSPGSLYPSNTSQENPLKLDISVLGNTIKFSR